MMEKEKIMKEIIIIQMVVAVAVARAIMAKEDVEGADEVAAEEATSIVSI
jgi:ABC-type cobalt transport system substrate-binding protein